MVGCAVGWRRDLAAQQRAGPHGIAGTVRAEGRPPARRRRPARQTLEGSYAPTPPEDADGKPIEKDLPAEIVESGGWKVPDIAKEMRSDLAQMIETVIARVTDRDARIAGGESIADRRPVWRVLTRELWRQHGVLIDLEGKVDGDRDQLVNLVTNRVAKDEAEAAGE